MSDQPIVPTADNILTPALERLYALRPSTFPFANLRNGVYWHPFLGFRAQAALAVRRLSLLVGENKLSFATGQDLKDYVASEYDAVPDTGTTTAIGSATFTRTSSSAAGDIPAGTLLQRDANTTTQIPVTAASYITLLPAHFAIGQTTVGPVPIQAVSAGSGPNHPIRTDAVDPGVSIATTLFDRTIEVSAFEAAGGADDADDNYVRRYAKAFQVGQYGPTDGESKYGALKSTGVRNMLVFDVPGTGTQKILVADSKWGSSARWAANVQQSLYDNDLVGFGCKVITAAVRNKVITVSGPVVLRDKNFAADTTEIDIAIGLAIRDYFDNRSDWNVWKQSTLAAAITRAHAKILYCPSVVVKDVAGSTLTEIGTPDYTTEQFHYYLANNSSQMAYQGPS